MREEGGTRVTYSKKLFSIGVPTRGGRQNVERRDDGYARSDSRYGSEIWCLYRVQRFLRFSFGTRAERLLLRIRLATLFWFIFNPDWQIRSQHLITPDVRSLAGLAGHD